MEKISSEKTKYAGMNQMLDARVDNIIDSITGDKDFIDAKIPHIIYVQTTPQTIENSTDEANHFNDTGAIGSRTIPARYLRKGSIIRFQVFSDLSNIGNPTNVLKVKIGDTEVVSSSSQLGVNTNSLTELKLEFLVTAEGATGKILMQGHTKVVGGTNPQRKLMGTTPIDFNTLTSNEFNITYTWGAESESNILTCTNASIEVIR